MNDKENIQQTAVPCIGEKPPPSRCGLLRYRNMTKASSWRLTVSLGACVWRVDCVEQTYCETQRYDAGKYRKRHVDETNATYEAEISNSNKFDKIKYALTVFDLEDELAIKYETSASNGNDY